MSLRTRLLSGEYLEVTQMYNEGVHNGIDVVGKIIHVTILEHTLKV